MGTARNCSPLASLILTTQRLALPPRTATASSTGALSFTCSSPSLTLDRSNRKWVGGRSRSKLRAPMLAHELELPSSESVRREGGGISRVPQSAQSVPRAQTVYSEPAPPSSQMPLLACGCGSL